MLELKSVDAGYGTFQALFGVNLEVKAGEAVGVIGPNGAGKTTLMRVISGLIRPARGAISMEGHDVLATAAHRIVDLGIAHVPENRRLFPRLTVDDNLKMGAYMPGARAKYAERRAADVRDRPRTDVGSEIAAARRAVGGAGAGRGAAGVRAGQTHPRQRADGSDRRAERAAGAEGGRPRLPSRGRHHPRVGHVGRDDVDRYDQAGISGRVGHDEIEPGAAFFTSPACGGGRIAS